MNERKTSHYIKRGDAGVNAAISVKGGRPALVREYGTESTTLLEIFFPFFFFTSSAQHGNNEKTGINSSFGPAEEESTYRHNGKRDFKIFSGK